MEESIQNSSENKDSFEKSYIEALEEALNLFFKGTLIAPETITNDNAKRQEQIFRNLSEKAKKLGEEGKARVFEKIHLAFYMIQVSRIKQNDDGSRDLNEWSNNAAMACNLVETATLLLHPEPKRIIGIIEKYNY